MKLLVLAAVIAAVVSDATNSQERSEEQQTPWRVGKQYRYEVESHTLARLQEGASSGNAFRARFVVRAKSPNHLLVRLENPEHAVVHQEMPLNRQMPEDLKYQPAKNLDKPFEILLKGGRVLTLSLPTTVTLPQENILKGLISALQVDLSSYGLSHGSNHYDEQSNQGYFRKMETDVTGECETTYTISPVASEWRREIPKFADQEDPIEVSKSKNYGHCHRRVEYNFGVQENSQWAGVAKKPQEQQFIKRSTVSRILAGKQGPIYKSETTSTVHVSPQMYGNQKAEVLSYVKMSLVSYEPDNEAEWEKPEANRVVRSLLFSLTLKDLPIEKDTSSSSSIESSELTKTITFPKRVRRAANMQKSVTIRKVMNKKHDVDQSSSSSESSSTFVNDEIPNINEPAYAALYFHPQAHADQKQNSVNAQKLVQELAQQLQNPNNMPKADFLSKFNILVRLLASMSYEQMSEFSRKIEVVKESTDVIKSDMWMVYRDAMVQAGTLPAFHLINKMIKENRLEGEEAAEVVAVLSNTLRYPTKEAMMEFFEMAMSPEVQQQMWLNSSALLAATNLIYMGQVNNVSAHSFYPTHMYGRLSRKHDDFVQQEVLPRLEQELKKAVEENDSHKVQILSKALGNLGHRAILNILAPYLEGRIPVSKFLRTMMVHNLRRLAEQRDKQTRIVLYAILRNTAEPYEVRVAAIEMIIKTVPTPAMFQAMAQMTHDDPSVQVKAALKSAIESAAELKNPNYIELSRRAQAVRNLVTEKKFGLYESKKMYSEAYESDYELGTLGVLSQIGSEDHLCPKYFRYVTKNTAGGWNKVEASFSSIRRIVEYLTQSLKMKKQNVQTKQELNHKYSAGKIDQLLNIKPDERDPLEASFYFDLMNQQRLFALSEEDIKNLPHIIRMYMQKLVKGVDKHYTKVINEEQVSVMFPVATGMPFIYKYKEPTVFHIQSKAKAQMNDETEQNHFSATMEKEIQFTYAKNRDGSVGFLDTLANQFASAGVITKLQINIPIKLQIEMKTRKLVIKLQPLRPDQDSTIVHFSTWPYSSNQKKDGLVTVSFDSNTKLVTRNAKVTTVDVKFGQAIGNLFQIQGYSHSSDYRRMENFIRSQNWLSNIILAMRQRDVALTHFNLKYLGKASQNKVSTFTVAYDTLYNLKDKSQTLAANPIKDTTPDSEVRQAELVKRVASGIESATANVIDLSAAFEGPQKVEYILTAAMAESPIDRKLQYALFASQNMGNQNKQVNAVGSVIKPDTTTMNFMELLQKDMKVTYSFDIKYGQDGNDNLRIDGFLDRSKENTNAVQSQSLGKLCEQEIANGNYFQLACYQSVINAATPNVFKASVSYKDSPLAKTVIYQLYRLIERYSTVAPEVNPLKTLGDGKIDIAMDANHMTHEINLEMTSRAGNMRVRGLRLPEVLSRAVSYRGVFKPYERVNRYISRGQYMPICAIDGTKIKTFSSRNLNLPPTLSKSYHVVMQENGDLKDSKRQLVILAKRPNEKQQEVYISYRSESGKDMEIEIKPTQDINKYSVKINTNSKKVADEPLALYWDEDQEKPLLEYYTKDGNMMLIIDDNHIRILYDGLRLLLVSNEYRNSTLGLCGRMTEEINDDYMTPYGLVDDEEQFAATFALNEESDSKTQQLQSQAKRLAYQRKQQFTTFLKSSNKWQRSKESSNEESSQTVYRSRSYLKQQEPCKVQQQVQYYENHGEICISTTTLPACQSHCTGKDYKVRGAQMVCRPKLDQQFQVYKTQIQLGLNPKVSGVPQLMQYRVPSSCNA